MSSARLYFNRREVSLITRYQIRVITKLQNTEQSSKGKVKTHISTNRQNQSTTGKLGKRNGPDRRTDITTAKRKRTNSDVQKTTDLAI
jgi:hypothetical protein